MKTAYQTETPAGSQDAPVTTIDTFTFPFYAYRKLPLPLCQAARKIQRSTLEDDTVVSTHKSIGSMGNI